MQKFIDQEEVMSSQHAFLYTINNIVLAPLVASFTDNVAFTDYTHRLYKT